MKDFDAEQNSLSHVSDASGVHQLTAAGPVGAYVVHLNGASEPDGWQNTFSHNGRVLEFARVYEDGVEIDALTSQGSEVQAISIPVGVRRDKFLSNWLKAASKNKKGLSPLLLIPLAACGGGSDDTSDSTVPTLAEAVALVNSTTDAVSFANGIKGAISDLLTSGSVSADLTSVVGDDPDVTISVTDSTGTVTAANLSAIGGSTTGTVTVANAQTVTGTAAEATAALVTSGTKVVLGGASTVTVSDATAVATAAALAGVTNATVGFTNGITGEVADLISSGSASTALSAVVADDADVAIAVSDTSIDSANAVTLDGATSGVVTVQATTLTGTTANVKAAFQANVAGTLSGLGNEAVTLDAGTAAASDLQYISDQLTGGGSLDLSDITAISGSFTQLTNLYAAGDTMPAAGSVTLTVTGSISADSIVALDATSGGATIDVSGATITDVTPTFTADEANGLNVTGLTGIKITDASASSTYDLSGFASGSISNVEPLMIDSGSSATISELLRRYNGPRDML